MGQKFSSNECKKTGNRTDLNAYFRWCFTFPKLIRTAVLPVSNLISHVWSIPYRLQVSQLVGNWSWPSTWIGGGWYVTLAAICWRSSSFSGSFMKSKVWSARCPLSWHARYKDSKSSIAARTSSALGTPPLTFEASACQTNLRPKAQKKVRVQMSSKWVQNLALWFCRHFFSWSFYVGPLNKSVVDIAVRLRHCRAPLWRWRVRRHFAWETSVTVPATDHT